MNENELLRDAEQALFHLDWNMLALAIRKEKEKQAQEDERQMELLALQTVTY